MPRRWSAHRGSAILMVIFVACRSEGRAPDAELVVEVAQERSETLDGSRTTAIVEAAARVAPAPNCL